MTISLTPDMEAIVSRHIASGRFHSVQEVVREGLRLLQEQEELTRIRLEQLRREIRIGQAQLEREETIPVMEVFEELRERNRRVREEV